MNTVPEKEINKVTFIPNLKKSYLTILRNSIDTKMFKNAFATANDIEIDILEDGNVSCAFFATTVLVICRLLSEISFTVSGAERQIINNPDWEKVDSPQEGDVLIWKREGKHKHIGFYIGDDLAISNSSELKSPQIHHLTYNETRGIEAIYRNINL